MGERWYVPRRGSLREALVLWLPVQQFAIESTVMIGARQSHVGHACGAAFTVRFDVRDIEDFRDVEAAVVTRSTAMLLVELPSVKKSFRGL